MISRFNTFYYNFSFPTFLQTWKLPTLPDAKKVALIAIVLFTTYKVYKAFQTLNHEIEELKKEKTSTADTITALATKVADAEQKIKELAESIKKDDFYSCTDEDNSEIEVSEIQIDSKLPVIQSPLELFKQQIPGRHLLCKTKTGDVINFADFLLSAFLRVNEKSTCELKDDGHFILTNAKPHIFAVSQLPLSITQKFGFMMKNFVNGVLKVLPSIQISRQLKGRILNVENGCRISFDESAIFLMENTLRYKAHLKSITILTNPKKPGHYLDLDSEHNSTFISKKGGIIDHQLFVELVEANQSSEA